MSKMQSKGYNYVSRTAALNEKTDLVEELIDMGGNFKFLKIFHERVGLALLGNFIVPSL